MRFIIRIFAWWWHSTLGTSFTLFRRGAVKVGEDEQGNRYFEESKKPSHPDGHGRKRRWVVYHGMAEASRVPPEWHGWLHHIYDTPPSEQPLPVKKFEKPHLPNMTGTALAYRPKGSLARVDEHNKVDDTYEAWSPEKA